MEFQIKLMSYAFIIFTLEFRLGKATKFYTFKLLIYISQHFSMKHIGLFLILFFFFFVNSSFVGFRKISFKYLTIEDGLSHNRVECVLRDSRGYLWIGTERGLNRFNGVKIKKYFANQQDSSSLNNNWINCLYEDQAKNLWIGTPKGLEKYDREKDTFVKVKISENDFTDVRVIKEQEDNILILGTSNGLIRFPINTQKPEMLLTPSSEDNRSDNNISDFVTDSLGNLWIATLGEKLWHYNFSTKQFKSIENAQLQATSGIRKSIITDKSNTLWIGTYGNGLYSFNPKSGELKNYPSHGEGTGTSSKLIHDLYLDGNTLLIAADQGGLDKLNLSTLKFEYSHSSKSIKNGLNSNNLNVIYKDYENILYIGTSVSGLNIYNPKEERFETFRKEITDINDYRCNVINNFFEDSNGLIWIGTDGGGAYSFNPQNEKFADYIHHPDNSNSICGNVISAITEDKNRNIWFGTWGNGLCKLNTKTNKFTQYSPRKNDSTSISSLNILDLYCDNNGNLWIVNFEEGVDLFSPEKGVIKKFRDTTTSKELSFNSVNNIEKLKDGTLAFASNHGSFYYDKDSGKIKRLGYFDKKILYDIYLDSDGNYWGCSANDGLILHKPSGEEVYFNKNNSFISNSISGVVEDTANETLWVLTMDGLAKRAKDSDNFEFYTWEDGLQGRQFTRHALLQANEGDIYIGGYNGFNRFHPENFEENNHPPTVYIDEFTIFNEAVKVTDENSPLQKVIEATNSITLSYKQSVFSLGFSAINFTYPQKTRYAYRLAGYETVWNNVKEGKNFVSYSNLDPGEYLFEVKATNNDGVWSENPARLAITITPPFWETWWFRAAVLLLVAGSLIGFYFFRISQLRKQQEVLEQKVKQRTLDLNKANENLKSNQEKIVEQNISIKKQRDSLEQKTIQLEEKNKEILHITDLLHQADLAKIRFFTNISHDFKTPLTLILGYIENVTPAIEKNLALKEKFEVVSNNAKRLLRMINQLLDFQKIDSNKLKLNLSQTDIVQFVREVANDFSAETSQRNIKLNFETSSPTLVTWVDIDKLDRILFNLISNACKYTPNSGIISVSINFLEIEEPDFVTIKVTDNGIGIEKDEQTRIFERFYQSANNKKLNAEGIGVGMALTKNLVELHKGEIDVESEPGKGTCFTIHLGVGKSLLPEIPEIQNTIIEHPESPVKTITPSKNIKRRKKAEQTILIVEDNNELRDFLAAELSNYYQIVEAIDGKDGMEKAIRSQPDLIISDVMMPNMDGLEMCDKLKMNWQTSHIPIIMLTAKSDEESFIKSMQIGADIFVNKPFNFRHLSEQIRNLLANRSRIIDKFRNNKKFIERNSAQTKEDKLFVNQINKLINENIDDNKFGVEKLADLLNMSRSLLYKKTLALLNISAGELIRNTRLEKSTELLLKTNLTVSEIAYKVGFSDHPQFTRSFAKYYGMSPKQFLENAQKNQ